VGEIVLKSQSQSASREGERRINKWSYEIATWLKPSKWFNFPAPPSLSLAPPHRAAVNIKQLFWSLFR